MKVIHFDSRDQNFVTVGDHERYFLLDRPGHAPLMCNDTCPHRGGPLHLGTSDERTGAVTCPWHETTYTRPALERRSPATVRVGTRITAVLDIPADMPVTLDRKQRILANECL
ncbi:MAG: Rieske 2Fe-2S domain-containing protein [Azospirillaceae bacterium]|nr:Rieske 2Fe-2S domain-containing protein [Azospirillaceae bacterium]